MKGLYRNDHQRNDDEYEEEEYDDYEEEGSEDLEEEEQKPEKERKPNKEELEFLRLREERKEKYRQMLKKQSARTFGHSVQFQDSKRASTNAAFGSFFGPSQPVIASRVLDESRSIRETQHIISRRPSSSGNGRVSTSTSSERKFDEHQPRSKVNEIKRKAQTLKDMRDYSFLLSDDADLPDKEPQPVSHLVSTPKPDARSTQEYLKGNISISRPLKSASKVHDMKSSVQTGRLPQTKMPMKGARPLPSSSKLTKVSNSNIDGNGHSKPVGLKLMPKAMPLKVSVQSKIPAEGMGTNKPSSKAMNGLGLHKNISTTKSHSFSQNINIEQKRASQAEDKVRTTSKLAPPCLKSQLPKPNSSRNIRDESLKKKPIRSVDPDDDDGESAIKMIRDMFRYNPGNYAEVDGDDSDMEADFSQIEREERRSSQIARREDEEELRRIEEEERRERMRKKLKASRR